MALYIFIFLQAVCEIREARGKKESVQRDTCAGKSVVPLSNANANIKQFATYTHTSLTAAVNIPKIYFRQSSAGRIRLISLRGRPQTLLLTCETEQTFANLFAQTTLSAKFCVLCPS